MNGKNLEPMLMVMNMLIRIVSIYDRKSIHLAEEMKFNIDVTAAIAIDKILPREDTCSVVHGATLSVSLETSSQMVQVPRFRVWWIQAG